MLNLVLKKNYIFRVFNTNIAIVTCKYFNNLYGLDFFFLEFILKLGRVFLKK